MKLQQPVKFLPLVFVALSIISCRQPKLMDIMAYNQKTGQWKVDFNLFPLNPNWQYKILNGSLPWTKYQCPASDDPADWKNDPYCTSQDLHFNNGQVHCTNIFSGHGGHMNWFPVTEVGIVNFEDHSGFWGDDDYSFYLQTPDSSLYLASDDPDPTNQFLALEFDSEEFPDPVDDDYSIWWNRFREAVAHGDFFLGDGNYAEAQSMVKDKLAIVTGMAGIDIGHDAPNTWTSELHPVFGMFVLTDEQMSINPDGTVAMNDTWSFFIRNKGNEGWCGTSIENAGATRLKVFIPEMPYYYAGTISPYQADVRDNVTIDDGNVHITNWNGVTDNNDPRREHWTVQVTNGGILLDFYFDSETSDGIFVGDIQLNWTIHIGFKGFNDLRQVNTFIDQPKFMNKFKWMFGNRETAKEEYETRDDSLLYLRISKLNNEEKKELVQALSGKIVIPNMPKLESIPKGKGTKIAALPAGKDSVDIQQFNSQLSKMKRQDLSKQYANSTPAANPNQNPYTQRKLSKRAFIDAYLKSKNF